MCNCAIKLNFSYISPAARDGQERARRMWSGLRDSFGYWVALRWQNHIQRAFGKTWQFKTFNF